MKRNTIAKTFTIAALAVLALGMAPAAKAENKGCSNASLKGTFADRDTGYITAPPAFAGPFAGINTDVFDGNGVLTTAGVSSINGTISAATGKGTYTVNSDCTGTYTLQNSLGLTIHASFVISDNGNELQILITDPGTVINCVARRQFPVGDWRQ